ncbi:MAG: HNH endonuclease [Planctomycetes bacterium]|nr:HNH endonuclease [Planctomycetota bacterium]
MSNPGIGPSVLRSEVPRFSDYHRYREHLRLDFWFSCAYCTIAEVEARGVGFQIDHHKPRKSSPELLNEYSNLMWTCELCNRRKLDTTPGPAESARGFRFFRPDEDAFADHFALAALELHPQTPVGLYTEQVLQLNREQLRRLRKLRSRLYQAQAQVAEGLRSLSRVRIDQIPPSVRGKAQSLMNRLRERTMGAGEALREALRDSCRSELLDGDPSQAEQASKRRAFLQSLQALPELPVPHANPRPTVRRPPRRDR